MSLAGGGGTVIAHGTSNIPNRTAGLIDMPGVCSGSNLMDMASAGLNGAPLASVARLVKLSYCYEHWDVFDSLVDSVRNFIKVGLLPCL